LTECGIGPDFEEEPGFQEEELEVEGEGEDLE
jgi:hypothetical protein